MKIKSLDLYLLYTNTLKAAKQWEILVSFYEPRFYLHKVTHLSYTYNVHICNIPVFTDVHITDGFYVHILEAHK